MVWHGKCALEGVPPTFFVNVFILSHLYWRLGKRCHSKGVIKTRFLGAHATDSNIVMAIYGTGSGDERPHSGVIPAKSIIPKELRLVFAQECPVIAQEYHSLGLSIAMRSRIVGGEIGPGRRDHGLRTARSCAKFQHVLFYRTSKANRRKMASLGDALRDTIP
jgi:hypothetical protein